MMYVKAMIVIAKHITDSLIHFLCASVVFLLKVSSN